MRGISDVQDYVNRAAAVLGLSHWKIEVSKHPCDEESWADIEVSDNLWNATLRVSAEFWSLDNQEKRRVIAHELLHVHYAGAERAIEALDGVIGKEAYEILANIFNVEVERAADALSTPVARLLPVIDEVNT
jgi:hypothetical protein